MTPAHALALAFFAGVAVVVVLALRATFRDAP